MNKQSPETKKKARPKKKVSFVIIDNSNLLGWLLSCFIICGCMFFLGVMVGRNTAPVQFDVDRIEEKLANLQDSVLKQKASNPPESKPAEKVTEPVMPIVHEDIIDQLSDKGKEPEIYEQYVPPVLKPKYSKTKPKTRTASANETKPSESPQPDRPSQPTEILTPEISPTQGKTQAPVVKPVTATVKQAAPKTGKTVSDTSDTGHGYVIQVASLKDPEKARLLMNKFKEKGYPAFCLSSEVNGKTWHRVRIGPYRQRSLADKDQSRLKAAGVDCLIISMD